MMSITPKRVSLAVALGLWAGMGLAADLALPAGAALTFEDITEPDRYALPVGPWADGVLPVELITGQVLRQAYRIQGTSQTPLQVASSLKQQIEAQGYQIVFECEDQTCGGFDFRFETEVLSAPEMYVDLTDFQFLSAKGSNGEALGLLISAGLRSAYVQQISVFPEGGALPEAPVVTVSSEALSSDTMTSLERQGAVILSDLAFETGSSTLGAGSFASLEALAAYLIANPARQVVLVGHTDAVGSLESNITLSKRRAASVEARLEDEYDVPSAQLSADGVGFLSPLVSNLTEDGRNRNRRVEAVLISTE